MSRKAAKKLKWTEQMNKDVLNYKRRAMERICSGNPPRNENGRKRGYIEVMKRLWDEMGSEMLVIKAQNLRDRAARLEGSRRCQAPCRNFQLWIRRNRLYGVNRKEK